MRHRAVAAQPNRPPLEDEIPQAFGVHSTPLSTYVHYVMLAATCGNCGIVCTGDREENLENLKILRNSGCVIQYPDGSLKILPGDEAEKEFNGMPAEHRALYC